MAESQQVSAERAPTRSAATARKSPSRGFFAGGRFLSIVSIVLYLAVWLSISEQGFNLVGRIKFPSPRMVIASAVNSIDLIPMDMVATLMRVLFGLILGVIIGLGLALWMSYHRWVFYFFNPLVEMIRPVPVIAMIPFFLMWFGISEAGKLLLVTLGVFAVIVVSSLEAIRNVAPIYVLASRTLGASKAYMFRTIVLPAIVPELIGPLRVATALSFTLVVAAEFMGADVGLGFRILEARQMFDTGRIFLGVILIGLLATATDAAVRAITNYVTRWSQRAGA